MIDLVNISVGNAAGYALLGYLVVFFGLVLLMCVILAMGKIMSRRPRCRPGSRACQGRTRPRHRRRAEAL